MLASVFAGAGGYATPQAFVDGFVPAVTVGSVVVLAGAVLAAVGPPARSQVARAAVDAVPDGSAA